MAKFPEAEARILKNKYVCKRCKSVIKSDALKVNKKEVNCKRCSSRNLRVKRKK
jgi:ribosomal protein L40E